jgi:Holliday junction resolvase RusA-like endonuclease
MIKLTVYGETPSKKNSKIYTRGGRFIPSAAHREWYQGALIDLAVQLKKMGADRPERIEYPVAVCLTFYHGNNSRRDCDNQTSSILDLLQDARILADDRWQIVREITVRNRADKGHARCEIDIEKLTIDTEDAECQ